MYAFCIHTSSCSNTIADSSVADCDRLISSSWCCISASRLQLVLLEDWDGAMFKTPNHLRCFFLFVFTLCYFYCLCIYYIYIYTSWIVHVYIHRWPYVHAQIWICIYMSLYTACFDFIYIYIHIYICIFILLAYSGTYGIWNVWICWIAYVFVFCFLPINASIDYIVREDKWSEGSTWRSLTAMMKEQNEVTATGKKLP